MCVCVCVYVCESVVCVTGIAKLAPLHDSLSIFTRNSTASFVALVKPWCFCINNDIYGKNGYVV